MIAIATLSIWLVVKCIKSRKNTATVTPGNPTEQTGLINDHVPYSIVKKDFNKRTLTEEETKPGLSTSNDGSQEKKKPR